MVRQGFPGLYPSQGGDARWVAQLPSGHCRPDQPTEAFCVEVRGGRGNSRGQGRWGKGASNGDFQAQA